MEKKVDPVVEALETFSRDFLFLVNTSRSFPDGHPSAARVLALAAGWWLPDKRRLLTIGVTRAELVVDGRFYGSKRSRSSELAALLNGRSLKSLTLTKGFSGEDLWAAARALSDRAIPNGEEIAKEIARLTQRRIQPEPLDISRIHRAFDASRDQSSLDRKARGQQAWLWLQAENANPRELAGALATSDLWEQAFSEHDEIVRLGYVLAGLGQRLDQSLDFLGDEDKAQLLGRLSTVGRRVSALELASILATCPEAVSLQQGGMNALLGDVGGEKLIDLMAGVVAQGENAAGRVQELLGRIRVENPPARALEITRQRLASTDRHGFAVQVWQNLEEMLLNVNYEAVMKEDYADSLRAFSKARRGFVESGLILEEDPAAQFNLLYLSLALSGGGVVASGWEELFGRIRALADSGDPEGALKLTLATVDTAPYALSGAPDLPLLVVRAAILHARKLGPDVRRDVVRFASTYGAPLLDQLLATLKEVEKLSSRKLLVDVLAGLSRETTPALVSRSRLGPWFITRNLLIVLGRRGDPAALPYVASALHNADERVRREALRALARLGEGGRGAIEDFAGEKGNEERDVRLARAILSRLAR